MKIFLILLFSQLQVSGQKIILKIANNNIPVQFATISDTKKGIVGFSNKDGIAILNAESYNLTVSHVSFKDFPLNISSTKDTLINISLDYKVLSLENVAVIAKKIDKSKIYSFGTYNKKTSSRFLLRQKIMLGIKFPNLSLEGDSIKYLRSIKFKLDKSYYDICKECVLEFKIYELTENNTNISDNPLNTKPIYIKLNDLRKKNEVLINENIKLPNDGIFISLEFPETFDLNYDWTISFVGDPMSEIPLVFVTRNHNGKWSKFELSSQQLNKFPNEKYLQLNFGLTYWQ